MNKSEKTSINIGEIERQLILAALALALAAPVGASDWELGAKVNVTETYTDNATLGTTGATGGSKSDFVTAITPSVSATKNGARLKVDASYSNQNLFYANDSRRNKTYHQLNAHANAELLEDEVFLDTSASITQASISPLAASGVDNTSATGNLTSVQTLTVSPYWTHRFGSTATLNARYSISEVSNGNSGLAGSTNSSTNLSLASGSAFGRVSWGLNYSERIADYQDRSDATFSTTTASLGYMVSSRVKITGTLGNEKNDYVSTSGAATGGSFWNVTGSWAPSTRTSLDLGFGHRYYGKSWNMAFKTRGVYSEWSADYSESVTTSNSQASGVTPTPFQIPVPGGTFSGTYYDPTRIQTNQVFLSKRFGTGFSWKKGKNGFTLNAYRAQQKALESGPISATLSSNTGAFENTSTIKQIGISAGWTLELTPLMSTSVTGGVNRSSYPGLGREDTNTNLQLGLNRKFSPKLTGNVSLRRQMRDSNQNADYTENALSGSVTYTF